MHRIDHVTASPTLPAPAVQGTPGYFTNGNPQTGTPATIPGADWANALTEELCNVVTNGGLLLDKTANNQLFLAIQAMIGQATGSSVAWGSIGGILANQTDLAAALAGKAAGAHNHAIGDVNGLQIALDAKATKGANVFTGIQSAPGFARTSDRRLKTDITPFPAIDAARLPALCSWVWGEQSPHAGQPDSGVIADEVEALFPGCVHVGEDGYKRVDYGKLAVHLILANRA